MRLSPLPRFVPAAVLGLVLCLQAVAAGKPSPAFHDLTFDAATARATAEQKIVFIDFYTTWCAPCKMLDETTWQNAPVIGLLQAKAIAIKIDAEKETTLAKRYKIEAYPTLLLLKPDGTELDRIVGYRPAERFIEEFNLGLAGKSSGQRAIEAVTNAVTEQDKVKARYDLGQNFAQQGKYAEALEEFLWCYDEGMAKAPDYAGVRNSFLLGDIVELGERHPPARAALVERRDQLQAAFLAGSADRRISADLGALNRELDENEKTLALFDQLAPDDKRRASLGRSLLPLFLKAGRYTDAASTMPYAQMVQMAAVLTAPRPGSENLPPEALTVQRRVQVKWFAERLEVLAGANDLDHARELLAKARAYDASEAAEAVYRTHLERAGHPELLSSPAVAAAK